MCRGRADWAGDCILIKFLATAIQNLPFDGDSWSNVALETQSSEDPSMVTCHSEICYTDMRWLSRHSIVTALVFWVWCSVTPEAAFAQGADQNKNPAVTQSVDFEKQIRPILEQHCWTCHGSDRQESGLRLDRHASVLQGGDQGRVVIPGKSADSRLIQYITSTNPETMMPPAGEGERLTTSEVDLLRAWIDSGVEWSSGADVQDHRLQHWAWQPVQIPELPSVQNGTWVRNPIDRFVLSKLEEHGIAPSPEADRVTLIRRLSLDLTGLLPTPEEVDAFVQDNRPDAYENLVDRLLASPHFGERWGRHWLDMARYADSDGYEKDNARPDAWRWRDWVIDAINKDLPFDQFTIEQIAGDLLPEATPLQRLATAFHRQTLTNTEGGTDQEEFRVAACFDRTETTGSVWLGLTIGCARCHTHKYDPISQREYYQLYSFFNNGDEQNTVVPVSEAALAEYEAARTIFEAQRERLQKQLDAVSADIEEDYQTWLTTLATQVSGPAAQPKPVPLTDVRYTSDGEVEFEVQSDGSVLVKGKNPGRVVYTIEGRLNENAEDLTSLKLDVIPHPDLPSQGPGRVPHGNFVLSELTAEITTTSDFSDAVPVEFSGASADFEQADRPWKAQHVIDGNSETGWAIGPHYGQAHWIRIGLRAPIKLTKVCFLRIRLSHQYGSQHSIGRFLLTPQSGIEPGLTLSEELLAAIKIPANNRTTEQQRALRDHYCRMDVRTRSMMMELDLLEKKKPARPELTVRVIAQRHDNPRRTYVLKRGEFLQPLTDQEMRPGGMSILPPLEIREGSSGDRLDLARWLVRDDHPLTPRVAVNHVWRILFGQGLVRTPGDFGVRGEKPTHPELLDWLSADFLGQHSAPKWSRKALIRRIVTSATYRQSSRQTAELLEADPQNVLLGRQNRVRVEGEIVRDISLQAAGLLSRKIGGPSVYPPLPPGIAELSYAGNFQWTESAGEDRYRRGMYTFFKRTSPHPNLMTFDCPDANITCVARQTSNTPLQALTTLNNETFTEAARAFADELLRMTIADDTTDDEQRLSVAFRRCVSRPVQPSELDELIRLLNDARHWYAEHEDEATRLGAITATSEATAAAAAEEKSKAVERAAWISVTRILLNLDEFLTRE